ncbi:helix-turn-helix domain-containing protein [Kineococcus sp. R8]|uniref:AraC-like ligand-binding domain-containing protein n=1 Tax=Kineococcus siccus TaxID=2696567 RepID=UPI0014135F85|nr:helix-turn-helix domain-containing protein [Kineococcus siccus]NAZ80414.1 helix-turn-helix domain-containing protein [Kineococcus siccus]
MTTTGVGHASTSEGRVDSLDQWSRLASDAFVPVDVSGPGSAFHAWARVQRARGIVVSDLTADTSHVVHRRHAVRDPAAQLHKLSLQVEGRSVLRRAGEETVLEAGQFSVYDVDEPYELHNGAGFRSIVVMFPLAALGVTGTQVSRIAGTRLTSEVGSGRLAVPFLRRVAEEPAHLRGTVGSRTHQMVLDLIATCLLEATGDDRRGAPPTAEVRRWLEQHLGDADLSPGRIAAAHYMSPRKLQGLFAAEGTSVSAWVRERRLEACRRDLADGRMSGVSIATVARRWGFNDPTHFTRLFHRSFGTTPSEYRLTGPGRGAAPVTPR